MALDRLVFVRYGALPVPHMAVNDAIGPHFLTGESHL